MKFTIKTLATAIGLVVASTSCAQEGSKPTAATQATAKVTSTPVACDEKDVYVIVDVTGSFTEYVLHEEFWNSVKNRLKKQFPPKLCIGAEVSTGILGQSHAKVTGTLDHLLGKPFTISRNHYTAENIIEVVNKKLDGWRSDLKSGRIPKQGNTSVAGAFDKLADQIALRGRPSVILAITDAEETELAASFPTPRDKGNLKGAEVYILGAGVTLEEGTQARRDLRKNWLQFMQVAQASKFYWVEKP